MILFLNLWLFFFSLRCSDSLLKSEEQRKAPNMVYQGILQGVKVAVKKLPVEEWPDAEAFKVNDFLHSLLSLHLDGSFSYRICLFLFLLAGRG